ncbi:hypothetical protein [Agrobacterium tumefaciens]|uniref:hypothetical protein n=1 Tax=Agrobacterium tumefaciens TaxID=358 RepID=UPI002242CD96|nr:hypothetical protein [Agrobacterium tumefaciens]MCW8060483.1 hypothetical protein [Agrobacterium tumefaciens]MCW8145927.1 hypothetical protein [Agrobacterium tumefaciens]
MTSTKTAQSVPYHSDDIAVWPDGTWANLGDVENGEFSFMSDDYEIVRLEDHPRLRELGLDRELDID